MIRALTAVGLTCVVFLFPAALRAQVPASRTITVSGQSEIRVVPDEVLLTLGVETHDLDIALARRENEGRIAALLAAAEKASIPREHVRTDFLDIQPRYDDSWERRRFLGYFARRSLVITLRDLTKFEALLSDALTAGANYMHGVEFRTTELRKHRDEARTRALQAAREKAEAMSGALGVRIGAPASIQEGSSGWWSPYGSWWGARGGSVALQNVVQERGRGGSDDGALVPGQIAVSASVSVTFELAAP
jgi:uncharacterized protein YggE